MAARQCTGHLAERLLYAFDILFGDADTAIGHPHDDTATGLPFDRHLDPAAFRGEFHRVAQQVDPDLAQAPGISPDRSRSEEHTSELQSLMRISYAVFCLKKKKK